MSNKKERAQGGEGGGEERETKKDKAKLFQKNTIGDDMLSHCRFLRGQTLRKAPVRLDKTNNRTGFL